ncbi:helix-turn-helix domain-containing protein [Aquirufa regiilacus]|uniref:Helix-turn-helix transcriptional regulator n=1 Tax=Aquirufa regiilacus TaxID=3024868 RepID=A0ABU3TQ62_9BACT|nr:MULTISPECIES: helix-turn-helix transcriptional regulator [unclassified Aquirufa]MDT8887313.1 helix-turn-helix transcriptional regulator [Aquirufa sp. LEPPI-3A]MDU0808013.1 helix-turn-helix transcriptional regulator [Aquirufa sp. LEOWEIH-7C]
MKIVAKKIDVCVEKTSTGYAAFVESMHVYTTAQQIPELYMNLLEALNLALEDEGKQVTMDQIKLNLDFKQFFQFYKVINANFLAKRIGMNPSLLSQYVRGKKHPSAKQSEKIIRGVQSIGKELADISLLS